MDRYKEIEAFVQVMEHGSLAAAALHAGITPVMMGRRIDALEKRLGTQLMHRSTRRLVLTDAGARFLDECRPLLAQYLLMTLTMVAVDLVVMAGYTGLAARVLKLLREPGQQRLLNRVFGGLFGAAASLLATLKQAAH